jgi:hypothetical protein
LIHISPLGYLENFFGNLDLKRLTDLFSSHSLRHSIFKYINDVSSRIPPIVNSSRALPFRQFHKSLFLTSPLFKHRLTWLALHRMFRFHVSPLCEHTDSFTVAITGQLLQCVSQLATSNPTFTTPTPVIITLALLTFALATFGNIFDLITERRQCEEDNLPALECGGRN